MLLTQTQVGPYKSFYSVQSVSIQESVTVLVGMNESGKTVFLQSLEKSRDAQSLAKFDPIYDYPKKDLTPYLKIHSTNPAKATILTYTLSDKEVEEINKEFQTKLRSKFSFSVSHLYDNNKKISVEVDESPVIKAIASNSELSPEVAKAIKKSKRINEIPDALENIKQLDKDKDVIDALKARIEKSDWDTVLAYEIWCWLSPRIPQFLYFGEYDLLPSKTNLLDLGERLNKAASDPKQLTPSNRAVLALLRMADISIADFTTTGGYEPLKSKIEAVSITLTDQIMEFWKQNENLEVEIDIRVDPEDDAPFSNGPNLYLRIRNRRHRGVSTPFHLRSKGFIWFFSFLVWFDSVKHQLESTDVKSERDLILLLDEPGLALHALAQADFLRYIDDLSKKHQVVFSTHSPFMVNSERLHEVRVVEDKEKVGSVISDNISGSDPRTIFPLQAALGWTIAQNLFISEKNLLVEGPSELIYIKLISSVLESMNNTFLNEDITIVPVGGLDKVATFIALLGANDLKIAVLHDFNGSPEQKLMEMVKHKIVPEKAILNVSQFRDLKQIGENTVPSDIEDLFDPKMYIEYFNKTFSKQLAKNVIKLSDLPKGDRIVTRIEKMLVTNNIQIRPSGGFNHYLVSSYIASNPPKNFDEQTLSRFEELFKMLNKLI